jgi:hypothetical protein
MEFCCLNHNLIAREGIPILGQDKFGTKKKRQGEDDDPGEDETPILPSQQFAICRFAEANPGTLFLLL